MARYKELCPDGRVEKQAALVRDSLFIFGKAFHECQTVKQIRATRRNYPVKTFEIARQIGNAIYGTCESGQPTLRDYQTRVKSILLWSQVCEFSQEDLDRFDRTLGNFAKMAGTEHTPLFVQEESAQEVSSQLKPSRVMV